MPGMMSSCISRALTKICCCAVPQEQNIETTNNQQLKKITINYREIAKNPKKAMLYWLETAMNLESDTVNIDDIYTNNFKVLY